MIGTSYEDWEMYWEYVEALIVFGMLDYSNLQFQHQYDLFVLNFLTHLKDKRS